MLCNIHTHRLATMKQCDMPMSDDRFSRDQREDMKTAIDLIWKLKQDLDKLHPECMPLVERMLGVERPRF